MSDTLGQRHNQGKPRFDLIPWYEFQTTQDEIPVAMMYQGLLQWWVARPFSADDIIAIPTSEIADVAAVLAFGAAKYAARNWEKGLPFSSCFASACRHATALASGQRNDPESGLPHAAHFWCNVLFLAVFTRRGRAELDDRPAPVAAVADALAKAKDRVHGTSTGVVWSPLSGTNGGLAS